MAKVLLLTSLLILILVTSSVPPKKKDIGPCPDKWVLFGHSCYRLISEKHRWHDAQNICKNLNSSLVNIGSNEEDQFVIKLGHTKGVSTWTGLSDVVQEGHFVWTDTQKNPKYTNWFPGQPDNSKKKEDCAVLWYEHGGKWTDADCGNKFAAVCEKPSSKKPSREKPSGEEPSSEEPSSEETSSEEPSSEEPSSEKPSTEKPSNDDDDDKETKGIDQCPDKWVLFGHSCYQLIRQRHRWHDAQTMCKTLHSFLVNIGSNEEDQFVFKLGNTTGVSAWTGLSDVVQEGQFVWTDTQKEPEYTNWYPGEPDNSKKKEDCAVLWYEHKGKWKDVDCETKFAAVCEKPSIKKPSSKKPSSEEPSSEKPSSEEPSSEEPSREKPSREKPSRKKPSHDDDDNETKDIDQCPDKWVLFGHSCYQLIRQRHRWHDAQTVCKTLHSSLVNIGSNEEDQFVFKLGQGKGVSAWIGLSDVVQEGHFVWTDTQKDPEYTNWYPGEPDNSKKKEDCAVLWYEHKGKWKDADCETKFAAVCEKPSNKKPSREKPSGEEPSGEEPSSEEPSSEEPSSEKPPSEEPSSEEPSSEK